MNPGLVELVFVFGTVLALAAWQLWDVRPSKDRRPDEVEDDAEAADSDEGAEDSDATTERDDAR